MTTRFSTIYALCDPVTGEVRYIGKTVNSLGTRLSQHATQAAKNLKTHLHCWMRSLPVRPLIKALEVVPYEADAAAEIRLIAEYRANGATLTNATDGGEGKKGCFHSEETKAKIRAYNVGRKMAPRTPESLQRMADAQRGKKHSPEHRAKIAAGGVGRTLSAETRAKLSAAKRGVPLSDQARSNMSNARRGKPMSEAAKAARRGKVASPETLAKLSAVHKGKPWTEARRAAHVARFGAL